MSLYFLRQEVSIYWNTAIVFLFFGITNMVFIMWDLISIYYWKFYSYNYLPILGSVIIYDNNPELFNKETFPSLQIILLILPVIISIFVLIN